jgi:hypothetical protein
MMCLKNLKAVIVLLFCAITVLNAQFNRNAVYGYFGGTYGLGGGLHYERIFMGGSFVHMSMQLGIGFSHKGVEPQVDNTFYAPLGLALSVGSRQHFLEIGVAILSRLNVGIAEKNDFYALPTAIGANLQLGYKYISKKNPGLFYKIFGNAFYRSDTDASSLYELEPMMLGVFKAKSILGMGIAMGIAF